MDGLSVDGRSEVVELVQQRLLRPPVVLLAPVVDQLTQIVDRNPVIPPRPFDLIGESGPGESVLQVVDERIVNTNFKLLDSVTHWHPLSLVGQRAVPRTPPKS